MPSISRNIAVTRVLEYSGKIKRVIVVLVTTLTEREFYYRTKVMDEIVKETGGVDLVEKGVAMVKSINFAEDVRNIWGTTAFRFTWCF